jgi:hypothetical protein
MPVLGLFLDFAVHSRPPASPRNAQITLSAICEQYKGAADCAKWRHRLRPARCLVMRLSPVSPRRPQITRIHNLRNQRTIRTRSLSRVPVLSIIVCLFNFAVENSDSKKGVAFGIICGHYQHVHPVRGCRARDLTTARSKKYALRDKHGSGHQSVMRVCGPSKRCGQDTAGCYLLLWGIGGRYERSGNT